LCLAAVILAACAAPAPSPTPTATAAPTASPDRGTLSQQLDRGGPIFRLWCISCHGDVGQGLTDEFRATWPPQDQNCWQSKCHNVNHPPGGFVLPRTVPALVGPTALSQFRTAADLKAFISAAMPFQEPGVLEDQDYWDLTALLLNMNHLPLEPSAIGPENADSIQLGS